MSIVSVQLILLGITTALAASVSNGIPATDFTIEGFNSSTWPNGDVPYVIDANFEEFMKKRIGDTIEVINSQASCVKLRPKNTTDRHFVAFTKSADKCLSQWIGFASAGSQPIYLSSDCSITRYIYWVLLQVLGLPAEHMRPDRDNYITVLWDNIEEAGKVNYKKYAFIDPRIAAIPYEYESRLHYSSDKFAKKKGTPTMRAINNSTTTFGNEVQPTLNDYVKLASLYCKDFTRVSTPEPDLETETEPDPGIEIIDPLEPEDSGEEPVVVDTTEHPEETSAAPRLPTGVVAGLRSMVQQRLVSARQTLSRSQAVAENCKCFDKPNVNGTCTGPYGFGFKRMPEMCRGRVNTDPVCECDNNNKNPCSCVPNYSNCPGNVQCSLGFCESVCR